MNLLAKIFGKSDHKGKIDAPKSGASLKDLQEKVSELVEAVNGLSSHVEETSDSQAAPQIIVQAAGPEKIDLASSKDPAHQAAASDDFQKLQAGTLDPSVNSQQPTQQNVPTPLPGGVVPAPSEVALAQAQVADQLENGGLNGKSSTTAQAEILDSAVGSAPSAK